MSEPQRQWWEEKNQRRGQFNDLASGKAKEQDNEKQRPRTQAEIEIARLESMRPRPTPQLNFTPGGKEQAGVQSEEALKLNAEIDRRIEVWKKYEQSRVANENKRDQALEQNQGQQHSRSGKQTHDRTHGR